MSVQPFDPGAIALRLDHGVLAELLAAAENLEEPAFGLAPDRVAALSVFARHGERADWKAAGEGLDNGQVLALIRLFTLGERLPGWEAGARSPVVPLAAVLKARGEYPAELTAWIRANSENRFLPYGSLMDRL